MLLQGPSWGLNAVNKFFLQEIKWKRRQQFICPPVTHYVEKKHPKDVERTPQSGKCQVMFMIFIDRAVHQELTNLVMLPYFNLHQRMAAIDIGS